MLRIQKVLLGTALLVTVGFVTHASYAASGNGVSAGANVSAGTVADNGIGAKTEASVVSSQAGGEAGTRSPATSPSNPDVRSGANMGVSSTIGDAKTEASQTPVRPYVVTPSK